MIRTPHTTGWAVIAALVLSITFVTAAGCAREPETQFITDGASFTIESAEDKAAKTPIDAASRIDVDQAADSRIRALASLRARGDEGAQIADILTRDFPDDTPSIPVYVERCEFEGVDAWLVVEAWSTDGESLTARRLWVFSAPDGTLLHSAAWRP